jgi:hypothetical protein
LVSASAFARAAATASGGVGSPGTGSSSRRRETGVEVIDASAVGFGVAVRWAVDGPIPLEDVARVILTAARAREKEGRQDEQNRMGEGIGDKTTHEISWLFSTLEGGGTLARALAFRARSSDPGEAMRSHFG